MKKSIIILSILIFIGTCKAFTQNDKSISDFYEFANEEWLDSIVLPDNYVVINQAGILWEEIEKKSIEILESNSTYGLDENHVYTLNQLRNFYKSTSEILDTERKRLHEVQKHFPMMLGIIFSKITLTPQKVERIEEIIKYLTLAYRNKINNSNKIGNYYKELFIAKLDNLKIEIGAPSLSDFPKIPTLSDKSYEDNLQRAKSYQFDMEKYQTDWHTPPYETDCFYFIYSNKIKIYAGILLDLNNNEDDVYLFATLGRTIAHEMTHAFDIVGKNYDENGKRITVLKKLFSGSLFSQNRFKDMYQNLVHQYNQYSINDSLFVDGEKTLQENIADLGGVEVSILALKMFLKEKNRNISENIINESLRLYFLYYARFWREKATDEFKIASVKRLHTPQKYRAIGIIYNQNELYNLYDIDHDSEYYIPEEKRITLW